jgi:hypothetical protein
MAKKAVKSKGKDSKAKAKAEKPVVAGLTPGKKETSKGQKAPLKVQEKKIGRPSSYSDTIIETICEQLCEGIPLAQICQKQGMPGLRTVYDWEGSKPGVSARIARAREVGEEVIMAGVLDIIDAPPQRVKTRAGSFVDSGEVANRRMRAEYRLKLLAKWNPRKWGEKIDMTTNGNDLSPTRVIKPNVEE